MKLHDIIKEIVASGHQMVRAVTFNNMAEQSKNA